MDDKQIYKTIQIWAKIEIEDLVNKINNIYNYNIIPSKYINLKDFYIKNNIGNKTKVMNTNKENIIKNFKILIDYTNAINDKVSTFKIRSYSNVIKAIQKHSEINNIEDVKLALHNQGFKNPKSVIKKIIEILETGKLAVAVKALKLPLVKSVHNLTKIYAIGPTKAKKVYSEFKITTIEELLDAQEQAIKIGKPNKILNKKQQIGLKYFNDLEQKIPRKEMIKYNEYLTKIQETINDTYKLNMKLSINGSFRRGLKESGDIDVLITANNPTYAYNKLIEILKKNNVIIADLAYGKKKFMGLCKLPRYKIVRHIDIIQSDLSSYPFSQLYFTGSGGFNTYVRALANKEGYSLNEYCFSYYKTKKPIEISEIKKKINKTTFENENDIFKFLNITYVKPNNRNMLTLNKL